MSARSSSPADWFAKAEEDLRVAEMILDADDPSTDIACYHAQQCAEKYLKGYLISRRAAFKFVHELAYLVRLCMDINKDFESLLAPAAELQDYATDVRYPLEGVSAPTCEEAKETMQLARVIRKFVLSRTK